MKIIIIVLAIKNKESIFFVLSYFRRSKKTNVPRKQWYTKTLSCSSRFFLMAPPFIIFVAISSSPVLVLNCNRETDNGSEHNLGMVKLPCNICIVSSLLMFLVIHLNYLSKLPAVDPLRPRGTTFGFAFTHLPYRFGLLCNLWVPVKFVILFVNVL